MPNTFLTLKNVREQGGLLHWPEILIPTLNTGFSSAFRLCNQNSTLRNRNVTKMQAFLFACILSAVMEKQTRKSGKLLLSGINRPQDVAELGGGGAKPKSGHAQQRYRDTPREV